MSEYFTRYGFTTNPFMARELNLQHTDKLDLQALANGLLLDIDGFAALTGLETYLKARVGPGKPAFVLVVGNEKSGLSSAAAAVLLTYREIRGLAPDRFVPVLISATDHSELQLYRRWVAALYNRLQHHKVLLLEDVKKKLYEARTLKDVETLDYDLQSVVDELRPALEADADSTRALASCLEKIKTTRAIEIAKVVFENSATVCVFTSRTDAFVADKFIQKNPDVHLLRLGHLKANEVQRVVEARWGKGSQVPFHASTFNQFCENRKHPVGVVLTVAEDILKKRVRVYEKLSGAGQWPTDPKLGLNDVDTLTLLEVVVNGGTPSPLP